MAILFRRNRIQAKCSKDKMHVTRNLIPTQQNGIKEERSLNLYLDGRENELLMGFKDAVDNHNTSAVFIFDGRSGMGKSTKMIQAGVTLDENFGLHKIHFTPKTFLEGDEKTGKVGLANAKAGDFIAFDEAMLISNRSAMSQINKMIIQSMSMIRSKRIYVAFCVNSIFDLDKNLCLHRADCLFHLYGQTLKDRGRFATFFKGRDGIDRLKSLYLHGKKYYDYSKPQANFIGRFTKEFVIDESLYEIEKQKGVNAFLRGTGKKNFDRNEFMLKLKEKGMTNPEIAEIVGLTRQEVWNILRDSEETVKSQGLK